MLLHSFFKSSILSAPTRLDSSCMLFSKSLDYSQDDLEFAITATKICVMLTSPLAMSTRAALAAFVKIKGIGRKNTPRSNDTSEDSKNEASGIASSERHENRGGEGFDGKNDMEEEDIDTEAGFISTKDRGDELDKGIAPEKVKNARDQLKALQLFKKAFISRPALNALVGIMEGPLGRPDYRRIDSDAFILELVITLLKNLICIPDHHPGSSPSGLSNSMVHMQEDLVCLMSKELLLDVLHVLIGAVGQQQSSVSKLNLILLETIHSLLAPYSPKELLRAKVSEEMETAKVNEMGGNTMRRTSPAPQTGKLSVMVSRNRTLCSSGDIRSNRHSRFGVNMKTDSQQKEFCSRSVSAPVPQYQRRGGMVGAAAGAAVFTPAVGGSDRCVSTGMHGSKARAALCEFALGLLQGGYAPFMNSVKLEFQRDSHRLESGDRPKFFELSALFMGLHRLMHKHKHEKLVSTLAGHYKGGNSQKAADTYSFGQIMSTMDMMCFNMVVTECSEAIEVKDSSRLQSGVTVLVEMMNNLAIIAVSDDVAQYVVALGLLQSLFHNGQDSLDPLPQLIRHWVPGRFTLKYTQLLLELAHVTLKILDSQHKRSIDIKEELKGDRFKSLMMAFREFDVEGYFCRRVANAQMVSICARLLQLHSTNSPHINYYILSMYERFTKGTKMQNSSDHDDDFERISLEPMLYNIPVFIAASEVLSTRDDNLEDLSKYFCGLLHRFSATAQSNRLAFVEVLLTHAHPIRYCKLFASHYNESLGAIMEIQNQLSIDTVPAEVEQRHHQIDCTALPKAEKANPVCVEASATTHNGAEDEEDQLDDSTVIGPLRPFKRRKKQNSGRNERLNGNDSLGRIKRPAKWTKEVIGSPFNPICTMYRPLVYLGTSCLNSVLTTQPKLGERISHRKIMCYMRSIQNMRIQLQYILSFLQRMLSR